ncbi:MAG: hypothetical protein ACK5JT_01210 [Hyphomicrobiaceae bacterium]
MTANAVPLSQLPAGTPPRISGLLQQILSRSPELRASLSPQQLALLAKAMSGMSAWKAKHLFDYQVSLRFFGLAYYFRLMAGRERRSLERLRQEGQVGLKATSTAMVVLLVMLSGLITLLVLLALYAMKTLLGFDFFDGPSVFHGATFAGWWGY